MDVEIDFQKLFKRSTHSASPTKWLSWAGKLRKIKIISQFLIAQTLKNRASDGVWGVYLKVLVCLGQS